MSDALRALKEALLAQYGHFADRRIKNIDKGDRFIIDDRETNKSYGSDGTPYGWFCEIYADIEDAASIKITIVGPLPTGDVVENWMVKYAVKVVEGTDGGRDRHIFQVTPSNIDVLASLAKAQNTLAGDRNRRDKSDYYVCPRIASSLMRLSNALKAQWGAE